MTPSLKKQTTLRFMLEKERNSLPEGYKKNKLIKSFPNVWTKFQNWEKHPPMIAIIEDSIIGFHAATFNKKLYINSYYLYVEDKYRGKGIAGMLFEFAIEEAQARGLTRFKNACTIGADGDLFYQGFGLQPIAKDDDHNYYDFSIEGVTNLSQLPLEKDKIPEKAINWHRKKGRRILAKTSQLEFRL